MRQGNRIGSALGQLCQLSVNRPIACKTWVCLRDWAIGLIGRVPHNKLGPIPQGYAVGIFNIGSGFWRALTTYLFRGKGGYGEIAAPSMICPSAGFMITTNKNPGGG